ncbi:uncharacterized protein [Lolium perenne]|uniref:uncharacterized protein isoform X3 n=1 Tax=Lolium perenne TaxID=4522 RepID=UPI0021F6280E|nr:uncharacterized protein LOC127293346 isoform X3 [Lolium perenne]
MPGRRRPRRGRVTQPGNPSTADGGRGCGEGGSSGQSVGADDYVPDVKHRAGADDGQARTVVMAEKEDQVPADSNGRDGAAESNNDQALVAPKGRCFGDEDAPSKFSLLQHDVNDRPCVCDSGAIDGLTFAEEKESQVAADGGRGSAGGNTGEVVMRKDECFLVDAIMNWRMEDVVNSDLFKDNVHQIPLTFTSVQQYLEIHNSLLLEETRANIQLGLFDLAKGPTYHALSVSPTSDPCVFFIDIDLNIPTDCFHIAEDGDLFLLTTQPHGEFDHTSVCFAVAIEVGRYSCFQRGFRVLVSKYHKDFNLRATKYVSFLTNIMGGITLSKAMTSVERRGSSAVESILWIDEKAKTKICSCGELPIAEFSPPNKFSDEQINALKCILSKLRCPHINAPEVLWGPPGSGKTEIAATMLHSLVEWKFRVLVCVPIDDASQIKEADLLIPLSMTTKHVFLLGDHLDLQATVKSEVCKKAGYDSSLFKRLLNLSCDKMMLTEQYVMHPSISLFVRSHFYEGKVEDAGNVHSHDYNKQLVDEKLPPYCFFDIMDVDELKVKGKSFVESSVIISLLQSLCKGLKSEIGKLSVAVLCLCSSRIDTIKNRLGTTYASHDRIDLEVNTLDNANESWYDIVILSSVFDTKSELPEGNRINTALTKSRHCLWIICEGANLLDSGGTWEIIYKNANERGTCAKLTSNRISRAMKMLELNDQKRATTTNSSFTGNIMQKPGKEWTWNGRPNNGKDILGSLRDQKNARDTCTLQTTLTTTESLHKFQCSCLDPPQDFPWELCFNDLNSKYEKAAAKKLHLKR